MVKIEFATEYDDKGMYDVRDALLKSIFSVVEYAFIKKLPVVVFGSSASELQAANFFVVKGIITKYECDKENYIEFGDVVVTNDDASSIHGIEVWPTVVDEVADGTYDIETVAQ